MRVALSCPMRTGAAAFVLWAALVAGTLAEEHLWSSRGPGDVAWVTDATIADGTAYAGTLNGVFRSVDGASTWQASGLQGQWISQVLGRSGASAVYARASRDYNVTADLYATRDGGETWEAVRSNVYFAAVDPVEASTVYAGQADGVIVKSADSGSSWNVVSTQFVDRYIYGMAFDTRALYVLTYEGFFRSEDDGVSWTLARTSAGAAFGGSDALYVITGANFCRTADSAQTWTCGNAHANLIRIVEISPDVQGGPPRLLASSDRGLLLSRDSGTTWAALGGELGTTTWIQGLAADVASGLIVAGNDRRMFRSPDLGRSWAPANAGLQSTWIRALALDPSHPLDLWAGLMSNSGGRGPGLFHWSDSSFYWSPAAAGAPATVEALAIDPSNSSRIFAADPSGLFFRSEDGGATWISSRVQQSPTYALAVDPESPGQIWAGTAQGLVHSESGGLTWGTTRTVAQSVYSLLFDQRHHGKIYAGSYYDYSYSYYGYYAYPQGGSIFVSVDRGATFTKSEDIGSTVYSIVQDPFHEDVLFVGTGTGVSSSADGGTHWQQASSGLPSTYVSALVADPTRPGHLYAATQLGVFRTIDGAHSWEPFSAGLAPANVATLVISPDGSRLNAGTVGGGIYVVELRQASAFPCVPSATRLCLVGNRYALDLVAARKGEARYQPGAAHSLGDRAGYFGLPSVTGDADLPEIIVKVLGEGAFGQPGAAVFYTSLTTLPYGLTVTDTMSGEQEVYASNRESPFCGGADRAFDEVPELYPWVRSPTALDKTASALEMLGGRFSVTLEAHHPRTGQTVAGQATALTDRSGFFGIAGVTGDPHFPEVVVKMVDGRGINGRFWFFHAGLTGLDYALTVTDIVTGAVRTFESPGAFCGRADINLATN